MKEIELSFCLIENLFRKGQVNNFRVVEGIEDGEVIVKVEPDMDKSTVRLFIDKEKIEKKQIECVKMGDD